MMASLVQSLLDGLSRLGYPGIVALMALESSIVPVPSELVMAPAGYLAAKGHMDPVWVVVAGTVGGLLGALANYGLAAWIGEPLLRRYGKYLLISEAHLDRSERFFLRHGEIGTFLGRFVPVVRHLISIPAGVARMRLGRFALFTVLGAGTWCAILTWIGWVVGQHSGELSAAVDQAFTSQAHHWLLYRVLPGILVVLGGYVLWHRRRRRADGPGQGTR
ncbi:MAG TPA: DedA family protein [Gemmatimonadales bacterium]|nr:DedA family protein [Gemmatimonadales bacterium]